MPTLY